MFEELKVKLIENIEKSRNSSVLIYVHDDSLSHRHIPLIYSKLRLIGNVDNLDIFLSSPGGDPDAAYKIVKMCRKHCTKKLSVIVPFMAKSAATLLAIGTDEILMGEPSELGPIDPQIYDRNSQMWGPTQSIKDSIDFLEERFKNTNDPEKTAFVLMPILDKLHPFTIGTYERAVKMSKQYAELLLSTGMLNKKHKDEINHVVKKLSESYYSHGYAIDCNEAKEQLHLNVIECEDQELWDNIWKLFILYHIEMNNIDKPVYFIENKESINKEIEEKKNNVLDNEEVDIEN